MMAEVFDEGISALSEGYVSPLLGRSVFWAMAAVQDAHPIGGITAQLGACRPLSQGLNAMLSPCDRGIALT